MNPQQIPNQITVSTKEQTNPLFDNILYRSVSGEFKALFERVGFYEKEHAFKLMTLGSSFSTFLTCLNFNPPIFAYLSNQNNDEWLDEFFVANEPPKEKLFIKQSIIHTSISVALLHPTEFNESMNAFLCAISSVDGVDKNLVEQNKMLLWGLMMLKKYLNIHFSKTIEKL